MKDTILMKEIQEIKKEFEQLKTENLKMTIYSWAAIGLAMVAIGLPFFYEALGADYMEKLIAGTVFLAFGLFILFKARDKVRELS